jgi:hypothetical protein
MGSVMGLVIILAVIGAVIWAAKRHDKPKPTGAQLKLPLLTENQERLRVASLQATRKVKLELAGKCLSRSTYDEAAWADHSYRTALGLPLQAWPPFPQVTEIQPRLFS